MGVKEIAEWSIRETRLATPEGRLDYEWRKLYIGDMLDEILASRRELPVVVHSQRHVYEAIDMGLHPFMEGSKLIVQPIREPLPDTSFQEYTLVVAGADATIDCRQMDEPFNEANSFIHGWVTTVVGQGIRPTARITVGMQKMQEEFIRILQDVLVVTRPSVTDT